MHMHAAALSGRDSANAAIRTEALTQCEVAERHAAVCAGAVLYLPDLRLFAKGMAANQHQADDLVQSTILHALDASHQFMPGTSPASRPESIEDCMHNMPVTDPSQEKALELCDLRRALAQLGPEQRGRGGNLRRRQGYGEKPCFAGARQLKNIDGWRPLQAQQATGRADLGSGLRICLRN
jgi:hypothetical protein